MNGKIAMREITIKSSLELTPAQKTRLMDGLNVSSSELNYIIDENLVGGIVVIDDEKILDTTFSSALHQIKAGASSIITASTKKNVAVESIPSLVKDYVNCFDGSLVTKSSGGKVVSSVDGVVHITGLPDCRYGELLRIENDIYALALDLTINGIGAIILQGGDSVEHGDVAYTTGKTIETPVGDELLGRVINPLGLPLDGRAVINATKTRTIEFEAPSIIDRAKVCSPLETGILAIDAMIPIGKGQRELIIGDRQTGKTSIAVDTIINQRGKDVICVYVAIGQRASSVSRIVKTLEDNNALSYTVVVLSTASDVAPLQYIAPYTGAAIAEHFMYAGKDVLIVYDDLSKHAIAYRTISLLLKRPAGREAFPGDIFYIHSRLLERAAKLSNKLGGGSMTALPIIETQAGDISAYIPTNVISITDGQIYLESELFKAGQRPAINVGLSVSRVGGSAQTKLMRLLSSRMRLDIAHYRELVVFAQFGSSLDETTKETLTYGGKIVEAIKQAEGNPLSTLCEEIYLFAIVHRYLKTIAISRVREFLDGFFNYVQSHDAKLCEKIRQTGDIDDTSLPVLDQLAYDFLLMFG
jgi:F-type H+-transporting ATPase subunit alpha